MFRDRLRTPNNILGDCYACAVVEHLSRNELKASDTHDVKNDSNTGPESNLVPEIVVVEKGNTSE